MKDFFKRTTTSIIISSIIAFIIGLIFVIDPKISLETIGIIVGIYIILHGIALIVLDCSFGYYVPFEGLLSGILSIVLGVVLLAQPATLATILTITIGLWIVLVSVSLMKMAIQLKGEDSTWIWLLILSIIDIIVGIIVIFNPVDGATAIVTLSGIVLMVNAVITIIDMIVLRKDAKKFTKTVKEKIELAKEDI